MDKFVRGVVKNKSLMAFLKRAAIFSSILIAEILTMTIFLDFSWIDLGFIIGSNPHLLVYLFLFVFIIISFWKFRTIKALEKLNIIRTIIYFSINIASVIGFYLFSQYLVKNHELIQAHIYVYSAVWLMLAFAIGISLLLAFFELNFIAYFIERFKKQIIISLGLSIVFLAFSKYSFNLWPYFSNLVAKIIYFMLSLFFAKVIYIPSPTGTSPVVGIPEISARIYAPCSGLESLGLFLFLFTILILLKYRNLDTAKVVFLYVLGIIGAFSVNILRTFFIFIIGYWISPEFAIGAFHSNVGWVAFTGYFLVFMYFGYPWMQKKK